LIILLVIEQNGTVYITSSTGVRPSRAWCGRWKL